MDVPLDKFYWMHLWIYYYYTHNNNNTNINIIIIIISCGSSVPSIIISKQTKAFALVMPSMMYLLDVMSWKQVFIVSPFCFQ